MCSSSSPAATNSSNPHRPAAARTSRQGSHQTVGGGGSTLLLLELSRPWANDVVMTERALGEKGCSRRFSHGSQGPAHARTGHALGQHSTGRLNGGRFPRTPFACPQPKRATACTHSVNVLIDARAALVRIADELEVPVPKRLDAWLQRAPCQARFVARKCRSVARAMRCWRSVQEGRAGLTIRGRRTCYKGTLLARVSLRADPLQRASRGGRRVSKGLRLPLLRKHGRLCQKQLSRN